MQGHIFGVTASPSCSNKALRQTADDNELKYGCEVAQTVRCNFYVDDLLKSIRKTDQATILAFNLIAMLKEGGFHLTKFLSNRREVLSALPSEERANPTLDQSHLGSLLGCRERHILLQDSFRHEAWNSFHHELAVQLSRISFTIRASSQSATVQPKNNARARTSFCVRKPVTYCAFLRVACGWILQGAKNYLRLEVKSARTSLR